MTRAATVPAHQRRPQRRRRRTVTWVVLVAVVALLGASCSLDREEPATVTLPEFGSTTTTSPNTTDRLAPDAAAEPLPVEWIAQVGGPGDDSLAAISGFQDTVVAVGSSQGLDGSPSSTTDVLVAVLDATGELDAVQVTGSPADDRASGVTEAGDPVAPTLIACGATTGALGATLGGGTDAWCSQVGADGGLVAPTQLGAAEDEVPTGVGAASGAPNAYVSGSLSGLLPGAQDPTGRGLGNGDALMMQLGTDTRPVWARQFGTGTEDAALAAVGSADGDGIAAGFTTGDLEGPSKGGRDGWISRFDPQGNQRWIAQLGSAGDDVLSALTVSGEASRGTELFVGAGTTTGDVDAEGPGINAGQNDAFVAAVRSDGTLEWVSQFGSDHEETVGGIAADGSTLYVTGSSSERLGELVEDGGPGGARDGFLAALDVVTGEVLWISRFGSELDEEMTGLAITENGLLVASGITNGQVGDSPSAGGDDGFVIAFSLASAGGGAASSV